MPILCPTRDQLQRFCLGDGAEALASHLEDCEKCQATLNQMDQDLRPFANADHPPLQLKHHHEWAYQRVEAALRNEVQAPDFDSNNPTEFSTEEPPPGIHLSGYEILREIGRGGMGVVYKARCLESKQWVAVKMISSRCFGDAEIVQRFQREIEALGSLDHPQVVAALDAGEVNGDHYLVMEHLDGVSLSRILQAQQTLRIAEACELIRQACLGLAHAHDNGLIHRDVKPANLMLCRRIDGPPILKVLDLGLARFTQQHRPLLELTQTDQMLGTLEFMAPEQCEGPNAIDHRADAYSLGATLYKLLTGKAPFDTAQFNTPLKMLRALALKSPPSIATHADLPPELVQVVDGLLASDPEQRPDNLRQTADALAPFCEGADLQALLRSSVDAASDTETAVSRATRVAPRFQSNRTDDRDTKRPWANTLSMVAGLMVLFVALAAVVFFIQTRNGVVRVEVADPSIRVVVDGDDTLRITDKKSEFAVRPGAHRLHIQSGDHEFTTTAFELHQGDRITLKVAMFKGALQVTRDGEVIDSQTLQQAAPANALAHSVRFGDSVLIATTRDDLLMHGVSERIDYHHQVMSRVGSLRMKDRQNPWPAHASVWTIHHTMERNGEPAVLQFGDYVYLAASNRGESIEWLTGNRSPYVVGTFRVYTSDYSEPNEHKFWSGAYRWQVRQSPEQVGSGPVIYGADFCLALPYFNSDIDFDGHAVLTAGEETPSLAQTVLFPKQYEPLSHRWTFKPVSGAAASDSE